MTAFALLLFLQSDPRSLLQEGIDKADLKRARQAIEALSGRDDERTARAFAGGLGKTRERLRRFDDALDDAKKALARYETMPVMTPADQKERRDGIEASRRRIRDTLDMIRETEDIHLALRGAFRSLRSDAAVAAVGEELDRSPVWVMRCEMAAALGIMPGADAERRLRERLAREREPLVVGAIVDALGTRVAMEPESVKAVGEQLSSRAWPVQIVAARALAACGAKEGAEPLVEAIQRAEGRVRNELNAALKSLTRTDLYGDAGAWAAWWKANGEDFLAGRYDPKQPRRPAGGHTTFFELPVISRRVAFVIDRSRSMAEVPEKAKQRKIDAVRAEMKQLLAGLPDGTRINVIFFGDRLDALSQSTRVLDGRLRREAAEWLERMEPEGRTNLCDALDRALSLVASPENGTLREDGIDTIFILSDGAPSAGSITDPEILWRRFARANRHLRAAVHTVAVGETSVLMSKLAELNDGTSTQK